MQYKHPLLRALVLMAFVIPFLALMLQPHTPFHISVKSAFIRFFIFLFDERGGWLCTVAWWTNVPINCFPHYQISQGYV